MVGLHKLKHNENNKYCLLKKQISRKPNISKQNSIIQIITVMTILKDEPTIFCRHHHKQNIKLPYLGNVLQLIFLA